MRPEALDEGAVARPLVIGVSEHDEQRRGVDAAVIPSKRHFAQRRHLAAPHLVEDLAGLRVLRVRVARRLRRGKKRQHAAGDLGSGPQQLVGRDQAVAAEGRAEPRDSGVRIRAVRRIGDHHLKIGRRSLHPAVQRLARRAKHAPARPARRDDASRGCELRVEVRAGALVAVHLADHAHFERRPFHAARAVGEILPCPAPERPGVASTGSSSGVRHCRARRIRARTRRRGVRSAACPGALAACRALRTCRQSPRRNGSRGEHRWCACCDCPRGTGRC